MYVCLYAYRHMWLAYVGGWQTGSGLHYPNPGLLGFEEYRDVCPQSFPLTYASENGAKLIKLKACHQ